MKDRSGGPRFGGMAFYKEIDDNMAIGDTHPEKSTLLASPKGAHHGLQTCTVPMSLCRYILVQIAGGHPLTVSALTTTKCASQSSWKLKVSSTLNVLESFI